MLENWALIAKVDQNGESTETRLKNLGFKVAESTEQGLYRVDLPCGWSIQSHGEFFSFCDAEGQEMVLSYRDKDQFAMFC